MEKAKRARKKHRLSAEKGASEESVEFLFMPPVETTYVGTDLPSKGIHTWAHLASEQHFFFSLFSRLSQFPFYTIPSRRQTHIGRVAFFERISPFRSTFAKKDARTRAYHRSAIFVARKFHSRAIKCHSFGNSTR